ncbi:MAG: acetoin utilization protein AcuC [Woeseiaceae bacterium]|nr:acetoin utilization protein AcuC [Woeseiaceae bacterium]
MDLSRLLGWLDDTNFRSITPATTGQLLEFHDRAYLKALQYADSEGRVAPDVRTRYQVGTLENPLFPGLFERAATTVGGSIEAARLALAGHVVFHPSGGTHHGRRDRACGFCYFNDPVFAILTLLDADLERVLYIDLDAHHGDGVEEAFFEDDRVTTVSVHEEKRWPYSGKGSYPQASAFNIPVPRAFNDSELEFVMDEAVMPLAESADALVLCCGADALAGDPLSGMELTNVALWDAVDRLVALGRPTVVLGGGGYNPWTLARYWAGLWGRLSGQQIPERLPDEAIELLRGLECDLVDEEDVDPHWLTTMADTPYPGPIRESLKSTVGAIDWRKHAGA